MAALDADLRDEARYLALAAPALLEAMSGAVRDRAPPLFLVLPPRERPDARSLNGAALVARLAAAIAPHRLDVDASEVVRAGHAGFAAALDRARRALFMGDGQVVVGAIDTPFHQDAVTWLDEHGVLLTDDRANGRIPTEAAAFVRLAARPAKAQRRRTAVAAVEVERTDVGRLLRRVAKSPRAGHLAWVISDVNGEVSRSDAWTDACRTAADALTRADAYDPVQHTGDMGSATGAVLFVVADVLARAGAVRHPSAALALSSDATTDAGGRAVAGDRAVIALDLPEPSGAFSASAGVAREHALPPPGKGPRLAGGERAQLERIARSCLEDIGSMGVLLAPGEAPADGRYASHAQRLLDNLDALAALGHRVPGALRLVDVPSLVQRYASEVSPPDRARRFAHAFALRHLRVGR